MGDCKFSCQNKYSTFQGMDDCRSYRDKNIQEVNSCILSGEISKLQLKKSNTWDEPSKNEAGFNK